MKKDTAQIKRIVQDLKREYNFQGPLHFTDFSNLKNIFEQRHIYSRNGCAKRRIDFLDVADQSVISNTSFDVKNYTRFYYKEKPMTLFINEGIKEDNSSPHIPIPVYFLVDEELLYYDDTIFTDGNAASRNTRSGNSHEFFQFMDWQVIFDRDPIRLEEGPTKQEFKRKRQAELLSQSPVSLDVVKKIIFRSIADYKRACNLYGVDDLFSVDRNMFNNCRNYIKDYEVELNNSGDKRNIAIKFETNLSISSRYKSEIHIYDLNSNSKHRMIFENDGKGESNFVLKCPSVPYNSFKLQVYFYGVLSIEEVI